MATYFTEEGGVFKRWNNLDMLTMRIFDDFTERIDALCGELVDDFLQQTGQHETLKSLYQAQGAAVENKFRESVSNITNEIAHTVIVSLQYLMQTSFWGDYSSLEEIASEVATIKPNSEILVTRNGVVQTPQVPKYEGDPIKDLVFVDGKWQIMENSLQMYNLNPDNYFKTRNRFDHKVKQWEEDLLTDEMTFGIAPATLVKIMGMAVIRYLYDEVVEEDGSKLSIEVKVREKLDTLLNQSNENSV